MIHPYTELRKIDDNMGWGVFATSFIPKGTIVYVKDLLEVEVSPEMYLTLDPTYKQIVDKYSYTDETGSRIISWDIAKYVNHRCQCNTMSTGYGFEVSLRDIFTGEEITDECGLFNIEEEMPLACNCRHCRKMLRPGDIDLHYQKWDKQIKSALAQFNKVEQPLISFLSRKTYEELMDYFNKRRPYKSVINLKYIPAGAIMTKKTEIKSI